MLFSSLFPWSFLFHRRDEGVIIKPKGKLYHAERGIDVNRDFPFDYSRPPYLCFQSETSRVIQELFYHNMFVATITFHGGDKSITYEWGDFFHNAPKFAGSTAPDHFAMHSIATGMNNFSDGTFKVGSTNSVVYPVRGGMEEWSYAGSWFNQFNSVKTVPSVCGNNIAVKMTDVSNRCLTFLVESDTMKTPPGDMLGRSEDLFERHSGMKLNNLIRQCLLVMDILQPYAHLPIVVEKEKEKEKEKEEEKKKMKMKREGSLDRMTVKWSISGCFQVDTTEVGKVEKKNIWDMFIVIFIIFYSLFYSLLTIHY